MTERDSVSFAMQGGMSAHLTYHLLAECYRRKIDPFTVAAEMHEDRGELDEAENARGHAVGWALVLEGHATVHVTGRERGLLYFAMSEEAMVRVRENFPDQENAPEQFPFMPGVSVMLVPGD